MTAWNNADRHLRDLWVLRVVLREHNLTRAAELLDTTQPSISKILARLREHFGDSLFIRNGNVMHTPRSLLVASDSLRIAEPSFDARHSDRVFKLLVTDVGMICLSPPAYQQNCRGRF